MFVCRKIGFLDLQRPAAAVDDALLTALVVMVPVRGPTVPIMQLLVMMIRRRRTMVVVVVLVVVVMLVLLLLLILVMLLVLMMTISGDDGVREPVA